MTSNVKSSIKTFLTELRTRIQLLSSNKVTENIDNAHIDEINIILSKYGIASKDEIKLDSIRKISLDDIKELLVLIGQKEDSVEYLLSKIDEHYEKICSLINKYISDFISIEKNQTDMINEKIKLYQKYIELFEKEELSEPFEEINEISKIFTEIGLADEDKWKILEYIAEINHETVKSFNPKLSIKVTEYLADTEVYLQDKKLSDALEETLTMANIDIDSIPEIAENLSKKTGYDKEIIINIVSALIASEILKQLSRTNDQEEQEELIELTNIVLSYIVKLHDKAVYDARNIRSKTMEYYINTITNGITEEMIKKYLETPISLIIEDENINREQAIELKELSVLKPIYETLDTIESLDMTSEEYKKAVIILKKLLEQYDMFEEKKSELSKEIN